MYGQGVVVAPVDPICQGQSATLVATVTGISYGTESYTFEVLPSYAPEPWYPDATGVPSGDDQNHGPFEIGFDFCFFNVQYSQFYLGSNGWVGFTGGQSNAFVAQIIPSTNANVPKNCIMAPWQDWDPGVGPGAKIFYKTTGTAPNRKLIVYWKDCPMYGCNSKLGNFQIVLYESGSEVYNHIEIKPVCNNSYSQNEATQGVHNATGTIAFTALDHNTLINRNKTSWYVDQTETPPTFPESTRFVPNGIGWHSGSPTGPIVGYGPSITVSPLVTTTYFAVASSCLGESYNGSVLVTVNPHPTLTGPATLCPGGTGIYTTESAMTAYVWNVVGGTITGGGSGSSNTATVTWDGLPGVHKVTVTYTDPVSGCAGTVPVEFSVNFFPLPVVTLQPFSPVCINTTSFLLTGGNPAGGTFSGPGVSGGMFTPSSAGVGSHNITYTYTDLQGCVNSASQTIQVLALPVILFSPMPDACIDNPPFLLTAASPSGGTYSGPGVIGVLFNAALAGVGTHTLMYTYTDGNNCTNFATQTIRVNALPVVTQQPFSPVCVNASPFLLSGGNPGGGTYSGPGVGGGLFNPATAGSGSHPIVYTYTDINGCTNTAVKNLVVNALPVVTLADFTAVCVNTSPFALSGGVPAGGVYSGMAVTGGTFNPATAGVGSHPITYTFTDANGCTNFALKSIQVVGLPLVDFTGPVAPATVCQDYPTPYRYQVSPSPNTSYTWTIPSPYTGIVSPVPGSDYMADVTWTGTVSAQLKLDAVTIQGCQNSRIKDILINTKPAVTLPACFDLVTTTNAKPFLLKGGTPLGTSGNYYVDGNLVPGGLLDPATLAITTHTVSYTYTDVKGCMATDSKTLTVNTSNAGYQCFNNTFTDPRNPDNATNKYSTFLVNINNRVTCWMLRNLNWGTTQASVQPQTDNCTVERYCAPADATCLNYGSLYQWDELMQYGNTPGWPKGVCPPGWHVPSSLEWQDLIDANQGNAQAGSTLINLSLAQGFHAMVDGVFYLNNVWAYTATESLRGTIFWTSTLAGSKPVSRGMNIFNPSVSLYESSKANAYPVRCVKD